MNIEDEILKIIRVKLETSYEKIRILKAEISCLDGIIIEILDIITRRDNE